MTTSFRRMAAAVAGAALALGGALPLGVSGAAENDGGSASLEKLGSCVAEKNALDIVLLLDETGSLKHDWSGGQEDTSQPGNDAENHRIPAAKSFIDELKAKQESQGFQSTVRVAGFGEDYKSRETAGDDYGEWTTLDDAGAERIKQDIDRFTDRTNEKYTNYANALRGAANDLLHSGSRNACQMILTFTDGDLAPQGDRGEAESLLCRPDGISDRLRGAGITNVGIGLSRDHASDFQLFRSITEGGAQCGKNEPNGAFFHAENVGGLMAAFHETLSTGGDASATTRASEEFPFWLDNSIDSLRFTAIAEEQLGENAHLVLTAPDGSTIDLSESGSTDLKGSRAQWESAKDPIQRVSGQLNRENGEVWAGEWKLRVEGLGDEHRDTSVFNSVAMQPDLKVEMGPLKDGAVALSDKDQLQLTLIGRDGQPRRLEGDARATVTVTPAGGQRTELATDVDLRKGTATVPIDALGKDPVSGRIDVATRIVTAAPEGKPGTELKPLQNSSAFTMTPEGLPTLPGEVTFSGESEEITVDVPVTGPGKVWVAEGATLEEASAPEGFAPVALSSEHNSEGNALELADGEQGTLSLTLRGNSAQEGSLSGNLPITVKSASTGEEFITPILARGDITVPVNKVAFTGALILALLLALLIPVLLFYLIRLLTSKVPRDPGMSHQVIPVELTEHGVLYSGQSSLSQAIDDDRIRRADSHINHDGHTIVAGSYQAKVKSFSLNPFSAASVEVTAAPSISGEGKQNRRGQAELPLAPHNSWFLVATGPKTLDLVLLPRMPFDQNTRNELVSDVERNILHHAQTLLAQAVAQQPAGPAGTAGPGGSGVFAGASGADGQGAPGGTPSPSSPQQSQQPWGQPQSSPWGETSSGGWSQEPNANSGPAQPPTQADANPWGPISDIDDTPSSSWGSEGNGGDPWSQPPR